MWFFEAHRCNAGASWKRHAALVTALAVAVSLRAQPARRAEPAWSVDASLGGFTPGNRAAVANWLVRNGYGISEPSHCSFDVLLNSTCDAPDPYPKVSASGFVGWTLGVRHVVTEQTSVELLVASEQSGKILGRCDDSATPRDERCTNRFMTVDFGGASFGSLGIWRGRRLHLGAGPALLLANWDMTPAHLAGMWFDARYGLERIPLFAHVQYRFYQSTSFAPSQHFTRFHPQTLLLGMGVTIGFDDSQP